MTNSNLKSSPKHAGYSLVELVMTLVLIGIVGAIGSTVFFDRQTFDDRSFFDETVSALRIAQKRAVASGCTVRANIAAGGYSLFTAPNAAACNNNAACNVANYPTAVTTSDPGQAFAGIAPNGVVLNPPTVICFRPAGNTTLAGNTVITVGPRSFTVWAETGFVQ